VTSRSRRWSSRSSWRAPATDWCWLTSARGDRGGPAQRQALGGAADLQGVVDGLQLRRGHLDRQRARVHSQRELKWPLSGGHLDLCRDLVFVGRGAEIAEPGVASQGVVEGFDEANTGLELHSQPGQ
jgi:hypothetical protein